MYKFQNYFYLEVTYTLANQQKMCFLLM